jgi:two-component sensor histidine kinase
MSLGETGRGATKKPGRKDRKHLKALWVTYALVTALCWTLAIGASLAWNINHVKRESRQVALKEARANFNKDQAFRHWATQHGGVYVPATEHTPPNPYLSHVPERDIRTPSGRELTLMNPAYMVRQMMESFSTEYGITGHITSLSPLRKENAPDKWEAKSLRSFEEGAEEAVEFTEINGAPHLRLMRPMITKEGCLKCHGHQGYRVGDIRGGVSVSVPLRGYIAIDQQEVRAIITNHGILWALGMAAVAFGFFHLGRNEKKRLLSDEQLKRNEKFLQTVIDGIADPVMLIGSDYSIRLLNIAAMGDEDYTALETPPKCYELEHNRETPCDGEEHPCPLDQVSLTGGPVSMVHKHSDTDGNEHYVEIMASPLYRGDGTVEGIIEVSRDITKRISAEKHLLRSLNEKEMLIKEIHHRVKNNLMVIQSLLRLQSLQIRDDADKEMFEESESRVRAMGMIHERLQRSGEVSTIDLPDYINSLATALLRNYRAEDSSISLRVEIEDIALDIDTIIPCGLIINELVSNALKYAFPEGRNGEISVTLKDNTDGTCTLSVIDNGIGLPEGFDIYSTDSLGMQIITALCDQISARLEVLSQGGSTFRMTFSLPDKAPGNGEAGIPRPPEDDEMSATWEQKPL